MPDISMCTNARCPSRMSCYRWTATPSEFRQAYMAFVPDATGKCADYWPVPTQSNDAMAGRIDGRRQALGDRP